ncbi:MAG: N-acetyl sugar amidotransferase, partial [Betaproteobacteria bacterium]|nr:N-acetyl sugar amidotransferase [Betaproteobacteria bacterium]
PWDGLSNYLIAQANGFQTYDRVVEGSLVNYENLDNHQTGIHDYFKFLKFGFGRATDLACLHIRRDRLTRQDGIDAVKRLDGKFPWEYLGKHLDDILRPLNMDVDEFIRVCDKFTNKKIFKRDVSGALIKDRDGNLSKLNYDNL